MDIKMPIPVEVIDGVKFYTILENNPVVMTPLAHKLGLPQDYEFHDIYSFDASATTHIPRPVLALIAIIPATPAWKADRATERAKFGEYNGKGADEPVLWFKQTIGHACGTYALIHSLLNGPAKSLIKANSIVSKLRDGAIDLNVKDRAQFLYDDKAIEEAHQSVAELGDTIPPDADGARNGQHFVAFVVQDGKLWELEGSREGPVDRGAVEEGEDVLSERVIGMGIGRVIELERKAEGGDLRFSCIALSKKEG